MSWDAIGAIGEIIGAAAVVLTLAYLGVQVRQNNRNMRNAAYQHVQSELNAARASVSENTSLARALRIASFQTDDQLNADEAMQFHFWMLQAFWAFHACYRLHWEGLISDEEIEGRRREVAAIKGGPGFLQWWESASQFFDARFCQFVDEIPIGDPVTFNEGSAQWGVASSVEQS